MQATNTTNVTVSLQLSEAAKPGTVPVLNFGPPIGAPVASHDDRHRHQLERHLRRSPRPWVPGIGHFTLTVSDALDNVGHSINSGSDLEIYNTALPSPPAQPVGFHVTSLVGGQVRLNWNAVPNAEIYRVYSEPGTNFLITPTNLVADNVGTSNTYVDLPAGGWLLPVCGHRVASRLRRHQFDCAGRLF